MKWLGDWMKKINKILCQIIFMICLLLANFYIPEVNAQTLREMREDLEELKQQYEDNQFQIY